MTRATREDAELKAIADSYRSWLAWDAARSKTRKVRQELQRIAAASLKFVEALTEISEQTRASLAAVIGEQLQIPGVGLQHSAAGIVADIGGAAVRAQRLTPRVWHQTAQRLTVDAVKALCERRGLPYSATADEYGNDSPAVAMLLQAALLAGDGAMTRQTARKWIEGEKKRGREVMRKKTRR